MEAGGQADVLLRYDDKVEPTKGFVSAERRYRAFGCYRTFGSDSVASGMG